SARTCTETCCVVSSRVDSRDPHALPTRRSSDLSRLHQGQQLSPDDPLGVCRRGQVHTEHIRLPGDLLDVSQADAEFTDLRMVSRSEEHTSELQSRFDLVCRLLLEKKKAMESEAV